MKIEMFTKEKIAGIGTEIYRLCEDITNDLNNNVADGIASRVFGIEGDESYTYDFLKNEGYDINYNDFTVFMDMTKDFVEANPETFAKQDVEAELSELSDDDLSEVAGGMPKWLKRTLIAVGAVVAIAAVAVICVATAGVGAAAVTAAAVGGGFLTHVAGGAITTIAIAGVVGAAGGGAVIAGVAAD